MLTFKKAEKVFAPVTFLKGQTRKNVTPAKMSLLNSENFCTGDIFAEFPFI